MKLKSASLLAIVALSASSVFAATPANEPGKTARTPHLDHQLAHQNQVISRAEQRKNLTPEQSAQYRSSLAKIESELKEAKSDGKVTKDERSMIGKELKSNGQHLRQDIHANVAANHSQAKHKKQEKAAKPNAS
jgi:predicted secreted protein